jgi:hypothetical protein
MKNILQRLGELWRGQLPLEIAFWHYAIYYGLIVNVVATTLSIVLLLLDAPIALAVAVHLLPLPYSVVTAFGVWRSADRYTGRRNFATFTRVGVLAWFCFWLAV